MVPKRRVDRPCGDPEAGRLVSSSDTGGVVRQAPVEIGRRFQSRFVRNSYTIFAEGRTARPMPVVDLNALLLKNPLFKNRGLGEQDKAALAGHGFAPRHYFPHASIVSEHTETARTFIVQSGWCRIERYMADGGRQIIDFPIPGDVIAIPPGPRTLNLSVATVTDVIVYECATEVGPDLLAASPALGMSFLQAARRRHSIAMEHMASLGRRSALGRIGHLLLELGARTAAQPIESIQHYECPLTQHDLADALGLTPIHLNRMLRELREDGIVAFRNGTVEFLDHDRLVALSDFDQGYLLPL